MSAIIGFVRDNTGRIANQNANCLEELSPQRAIVIDSLISENLSFIRTAAYLYGNSLTFRQKEIKMVREFEKNSAFDFPHIADANGGNYTGIGETVGFCGEDFIPKLLIYELFGCVGES